MEPITAVAGAVLGIGASLFGQKQQNDKASADQKDLKQYNKKIDEYNWEQTQAKYDYAVEGLKIAKQNAADNIAYQEASLAQNYQNAVAIQDFEYGQAVKAYNKSVAQAGKQLDYNSIAALNALNQQAQANYEAEVGLMFDENNSLLDYFSQTSGLALKKNQANQQYLFSQAKNQLGFKSSATKLGAKKSLLRFDAREQTNQAILQGLKESAKIRAGGGQGRSAARAAMGVMAESGARQSAIAAQLMYAEDDVQVDLESLEDQFVMEQTIALATKDNALAGINLETGLLDSKKDLQDQMMAATKLNLAAKNKFVKEQILQAKLQADINAEASMMLMPDALPPIPVPYQLPQPVFQEVFKPTKPPESYTAAAAYSSPWLAAGSAAVQSLPSVVQAFNPKGGTGL